MWLKHIIQKWVFHVEPFDAAERDTLVFLDRAPYWSQEYVPPAKPKRKKLQAVRLRKY